MTAKVYKVLFLVHRQFGAQHYGGMDLEPAGPRPLRAHGAGSHPTGQVHPISLELLARYNYYPTARLRSKSWDEFARPDSPARHFVFTVCDRAAAEVCPIWPGQPMSAHWGVEDPAAFIGPDDRKLRPRADRQLRRHPAFGRARLRRRATRRRCGGLGGCPLAPRRAREGEARRAPRFQAGLSPGHNSYGRLE